MQLKRTNVQQFDFIYQDMQKQFPPAERKPKELLRQLIQQQVYDLVLAYDQETPVGYILLCPTPFQTVWLDYIAVFSQFHSHGYGSKILQHLSSVYPNYAGCLLEVEQADPTVPNTLRRIHFYESLGCKKYPFYYALPTTDSSLPMDLYWMPWKSSSLPLDLLQCSIRHAFQTIHQDIPHWKEVYQTIIQRMAK